MPEWRKALAAVKAAKNPAHFQLVDKQATAMATFNTYFDLLMRLSAEAHNVPCNEAKEIINTLILDLDKAKIDGNGHLEGIRASKRTLKQMQDGIKA